ncbi:UNVERIFIED_CONTAM: hypothetical protein FKN15_077452 [Acipenser sinensis]
MDTRVLRNVCRQPSVLFHSAGPQASSQSTGVAGARKRNVEPVCSNLQSEILRCYREHQHETLNCSDLAREYKQCINAAKKVSFNEEM